MLYLDLAHRRLGLGLPLVELPLGERPVVVGRPVHHDDLDAAVATAPDDPAGGPHDRLGHRNLPRFTRNG
jgi:hypothetical protein